MALNISKEYIVNKYRCLICENTYNTLEEAKACTVNCRKEKIKREKIENIEKVTEFTITALHLKLLKRMFVSWDDCEFGAPCINHKRPYGNSNVYNDLAEIVKLPKKGNWDSKFEAWNDPALEKLYLLHRETQLVLQIILATGHIKEGTYIKKDQYDALSWREKKK